MNAMSCVLIYCSYFLPRTSIYLMYRRGIFSKTRNQRRWIYFSIPEIILITRLSWYSIYDNCYYKYPHLLVICLHNDRTYKQYNLFCFLNLANNFLFVFEFEERRCVCELYRLSLKMNTQIHKQIFVIFQRLLSEQVLHYWRAVYLYLHGDGKLCFTSPVW